MKPITEREVEGKIDTKLASDEHEAGGASPLEVRSAVRLAYAL